MTSGYNSRCPHSARENHPNLIIDTIYTLNKKIPGSFYKIKNKNWDIPWRPISTLHTTLITKNLGHLNFGQKFLISDNFRQKLSGFYAPFGHNLTQTNGNIQQN